MHWWGWLLTGVAIFIGLGVLSFAVIGWRFVKDIRDR